MTKKQKGIKKKVVKKGVARAILHIYSSFNNTIVSVTDLHGNVLIWSTAGSNAFKNARKSTPFAAQVTAEDAVKKAIEIGIQEVHVRIKGPGVGKESAVRSVGAAGLKVLSIADVTPVPHNGCRPPKRRRQ